MPFKIVRNDITRVKADVIVNTANPNPICVANIGKIARGDIAVTGAYNLKAKYIIHTVGPVWTDGDYIWIGIRAFTYVIIFTLIKIIVPKLLGNVKYKKDEMGRTYFSKKKISYFLFVIAVFFTVLLSFLSTIPSNVSGEAKIYLNVGIVIFCLLWYILSIMFDVWYIHLEPTQIIYRNYLGATKVIKASDIDYFERNSNGSLIIVCSDRKGREWI